MLRVVAAVAGRRLPRRAAPVPGARRAGAARPARRGWGGAADRAALLGLVYVVAASPPRRSTAPTGRRSSTAPPIPGAAPRCAWRAATYALLRRVAGPARRDPAASAGASVRSRCSPRRCWSAAATSRSGHGRSTRPARPGSPSAVGVVAAGRRRVRGHRRWPSAHAGWRASCSARAARSSRGQVTELTRSRLRLIDAFDVERRRIERDLHDGAQQQLVALAMTLDLARIELEGTAHAEAARLVDDAHAQATSTMTELRDLIHGDPPAGARRPRAAAARSPSSRTARRCRVDLRHRAAAAAAREHRDRGVLRALRSDRQRGQAQRRAPPSTSTSASRSGMLVLERTRRRRRRRRPGRRQRSRRASATASRPSAAG